MIIVKIKMEKKMKLLISGGCGFLGSNLASYAIEKGYELTVFDNMSRLGSDKNREWLNSLGNYTFIHGDTRNRNDVENAIRKGQFDVIFHLAGQVTMTKSITDPYKDFEINAIGALNVLESVRKYSPETAVFFSSTNKVYGDLENYTYEETPTRYICKEYPNGFDESIPLDFRSPYGCSKGCADQYMLDYARIYGLKTVVFRHSSMYGSRQFATYDQGWIGWFVQKAIEKYKNPDCEPFTISGNGKQVRDVLHVKDMVKLYFTAIDNIEKIRGMAFNIGGTYEQSLSLIELFQMLEEMLDVKMEYKELLPRESDQRVFVAKINRINSILGWKPQVTTTEGIVKMIDWVKNINI